MTIDAELKAAAADDFELRHIRGGIKCTLCINFATNRSWLVLRAPKPPWAVCIRCFNETWVNGLLVQLELFT